MTVSIPGDNGGRVGIGYALIAQRTGLKYCRVQRAFAKLYQIGWVLAERVARRLANGQLVWLPSMRRFTREFFVAVKKGAWYDSWTGRTQRRAQKQARAAEAVAAAKEEAPSVDPTVRLYREVLRRAGGLIEVGYDLSQRLWGMIRYEHRTDEDELVTFLGLSMAARAPP